MTAPTATPPPRLLLLGAFATVYLVWGSTYLAIRVAIETVPPFLMAGSRFLMAGALLLGFAWLRGAALPRREHLPGAALVGGLMLLGGNGGVVWAEQHLDSGVAAVVIATVPLWLVVLEWLRSRERPDAAVAGGLGFGLLGVALLVSPGRTGGERLHAGAAAVLLVAAVSWALGSLLSLSARLPADPKVAVASEMIAGGALLLLIGLASGEASRLSVYAVSPRSLVALGYLVVFGSILAFSAYIWLLRSTSAAKASTYAYVNPVVALGLGWGVGGETVSGRTLLAAALVIASVVWIVAMRGRRSVLPRPRAVESPPPPSARVA